MTEIDRLHRRNLMNNGRCVITATNDAGGVHKVQVRPTPRELIDDVPVVQLYGLSSHAPVGSEAHMLCTRGDRSSTVVVATNNPDARPRGLNSGEVALYTAEGDTIVLKSGHVIAITTSGTVTVTAPTVNIAGPGGGKVAVNVSGDIHCTGTITADTITAPNGHVGP
jgi:phage baseplate assembly protein V